MTRGINGYEQNVRFRSFLAVFLLMVVKLRMQRG